MIGIQASSNSKRFPNKAATNIDGIIMTDHIVQAATSAKIGLVVLLLPEGDPLKERYPASQNGSPVIHEWTEKDLLGQFTAAARCFQADHIMRITGDCPLITSEHLRELWEYYNSINEPYLNNRDFYPDGFDVECMSKTFLETYNGLIEDPELREHCVYFWENFLEGHYSVDKEEDLETVKAIRKRSQRLG